MHSPGFRRHKERTLALRRAALDDLNVNRDSVRGGQTEKLLNAAIAETVPVAVTVTAQPPMTPPPEKKKKKARTPPKPPTTPPLQEKNKKAVDTTTEWLRLSAAVTELSEAQQALVIYRARCVAAVIAHAAAAAVARRLADRAVATSEVLLTMMQQSADETVGMHRETEQLLERMLECEQTEEAPKKRGCVKGGRRWRRAVLLLTKTAAVAAAVFLFQLAICSALAVLLATSSQMPRVVPFHPTEASSPLMLPAPSPVLMLAPPPPSTSPAAAPGRHHEASLLLWAL